MNNLYKKTIDLFCVEMDTDAGLYLIIVSYILNAIFATIIFLERKKYITLKLLNAISSRKPASSALRAIRPRVA